MRLAANQQGRGGSLAAPGLQGRHWMLRQQQAQPEPLAGACLRHQHQGLNLPCCPHQQKMVRPAALWVADQRGAAPAAQGGLRCCRQHLPVAGARPAAAAPAAGQGQPAGLGQHLLQWGPSGCCEGSPSAQRNCHGSHCNMSLLLQSHSTVAGVVARASCCAPDTARQPAKQELRQPGYCWLGWG